jgi:hypothetical protein
VILKKRFDSPTAEVITLLQRIAKNYPGLLLSSFDTLDIKCYLER